MEKYRIMILIKEYNDKLSSIYKFLTEEDEDGNKKYYETDDIQELDDKVEEMLNGDYAKKDFIVVQVKEYNIDADIVVNNK